VAVLATILLGLGAGLAATVPVRRLVREIRTVGQGDLDGRVRPEPSSELRQIAEAVNAMAEDLRDRVRVRESLMVAMEVQKNLLPHGPPTIKGLDIAGHSTYCDETGGDYYDYLDVQPLDGGAANANARVALAIGDVMGHGVAAAMLMATARGILRSRCDEPASLGELLTHLNELLVGDTGGKRFMTMLLVMLDGDTGAMAWASAGHDPPMVYLAKEGRFAQFDGGGIPLGLFAEQAYETDTEGPYAPGDVVVLSTDGLWEARTTDGAFYGKQRLETIIRAHATGTAEAIAAAIRADHVAACGESSQADDITFVVAKMRAAGTAH
jgi:sigma-B regulation protein RsbU (phosphoserine phosphatase)